MNSPCKPDDPSIPDSEKLFRRVSPKQVVGGEVSDAAFEDFHLSVEREEKSSALDCLSHAYPDSLLPTYPDGFKPGKKQTTVKKLQEKGWRVVSIQAGIPRELSLAVYPDPATYKNGYTNDAHSTVCGEKENNFVSQDLAERCIFEL